jgi:hypothetical protein
LLAGNHFLKATRKDDMARDIDTEIAELHTLKRLRKTIRELSNGALNVHRDHVSSELARRDEAEEAAEE